MLLLWISRNHVHYNQNLYSDRLKYHMNHFYQDFTDHSYKIVLCAKAFLEAKLYFRSNTIKAIIYLGSYIWLYEHHLKSFDRISNMLIVLYGGMR